MTLHLYLVAAVCMWSSVMFALVGCGLSIWMLRDAHRDVIVSWQVPQLADVARWHWRKHIALVFAQVCAVIATTAGVLGAFTVQSPWLFLLRQAAICGVTFALCLWSCTDFWYRTVTHYPATHVHPTDKE